MSNFFLSRQQKNPSRVKNTLRRKVLTFALGGLVAVLLLANVNIALGHWWWDWHMHGRNHPVAIWNYNTEANAARADWENSTVLSLPRVNRHTDISVWGDNFGDTKWAGLASVESVGADWPWHCYSAILFPIVGFCKITHGHARYNSFYWGNAGRGVGGDVQGVFCQEIGHLFGLDHAPGDCMGKGYFSSNSNGVGGHSVQHINSRY